MLSWYCSAMSNLRNSGGTALEGGGGGGRECQVFRAGTYSQHTNVKDVALLSLIVIVRPSSSFV